MAVPTESMVSRVVNRASNRSRAASIPGAAEKSPAFRVR